MNLRVNLKPLREFFFNGKNSVDDILNIMEEDEDIVCKLFTRKTAKRDNNWLVGEFREFSFVANSITGFRLDQEDRYTCLPNFTKDWSFFGVYDGHGGAIVSEYLKRKLHMYILEQFEKLGDIEEALKQGFQACDQAIRDMKEDEFNEIQEATMKEFTGSEYQPSTSGCKKTLGDEFYADIKRQFLKHMQLMQEDLNKPSTSSEKESTEKNDEPKVRRSKRFKKEKTAGSNSHSDETEGKKAESMLHEKKAEDEKIPLVGLCMGSTATAVIFTDQILYVASVGDSKCISYKFKKVLILACNHTPNNVYEKQRILKSGHNIKDDRVDGILNMSRAFGDFTFKDKKNLSENEQAVISQPTIRSVPIEDVDFVIIASDGVWDEMDICALTSFFAHSFKLSLEEAVSEAFERVFLNGGLDNLTLIVIKNVERCALYPKIIEKHIQKGSLLFRAYLEKKEKEEEYEKNKKQGN